MGAPERPALCVDASVHLKLLLPDESTAQLRRLWREWEGTPLDLCAPPIFPWECANGVRQAMRAGRISPETAQAAVEEIARCAVRIIPIDESLMSAWRDFVMQYDMPAVYDAAYLALASELGCEFWTADRRLYRLVGEALPWVRAVGFEA